MIMINNFFTLPLGMELMELMGRFIMQLPFFFKISECRSHLPQSASAPTRSCSWATAAQEKPASSNDSSTTSSNSAITYPPTHPAHHRHRLPRQKCDPQLDHLPPPALGHRRPRTISQPHSQLPQGRHLRIVRLRCLETRNTGQLGIVGRSF